MERMESTSFQSLGAEHALLQEQACQWPRIIGTLRVLLTNASWCRPIASSSQPLASSVAVIMTKSALSSTFLRSDWCAARWLRMSRTRPASGSVRPSNTLFPTERREEKGLGCGLTASGLVTAGRSFEVLVSSPGRNGQCHLGGCRTWVRTYYSLCVSCRSLPFGGVCF